MDQFCLEFMRTAHDGAITNESTKHHFVTSLKECHANGYYLAFSKKSGWKLSNKKPESLAKQKTDLSYLIDSLFVKQN